VPSPTCEPGRSKSAQLVLPRPAQTRPGCPDRNRLASFPRAATSAARDESNEPRPCLSKQNQKKRALSKQNRLTSTTPQMRPSSPPIAPAATLSSCHAAPTPSAHCGAGPETGALEKIGKKCSPTHLIPAALGSPTPPTRLALRPHPAPRS